MIKMRSVYFTDDNTWFEDRVEAEQHEKHQEVMKYLNKAGVVHYPSEVEEAVRVIMLRYNLEERWDYVSQKTEAEEVGDAENSLPEA